MKILKRADWTATNPIPMTEEIEGPLFFREKDVLGINLFLPGENANFVELNPLTYFEQQRKADYKLRGMGDVQYNLGVASNVEGVYCLRGLCNKSPNKLGSTHISVLVLLGTNEPPTDLLLQNLTTCREFVLSKFPNATEINSSLPFEFDWDQKSKKLSSQFTCNLPTVFTQDTNVHTFDLIENLNYWGYYNGKNDGVYGPVTRNAVSLLQADLKDAHLYLKRVDGLYGRYTREAFCNYLKK